MASKPELIVVKKLLFLHLSSSYSVEGFMGVGAAVWWQGGMA